MFKQYTILILIVVATIMLSISQLFSTAKADENVPYMPRQINLSNNVVNFSMPENFSKDFPADDLVEKVNLDNSDLFKDGKPLELLRRWWDFKDDSFFAKEMGTMMMTIHAYKIRDDAIDIGQPLEFIKNILLEMKKRETAENKGRAKNELIYYPSFYKSFVERVYSNQKWLRSGTANEDESQMMFHYWIPIMQNYYLTVEFNFAPGNKVGMREFIDGYARDMLEKIMETFNIVYSENNPIKTKLEKNSQLKLDDLVKQIN